MRNFQYVFYICCWLHWFAWWLTSKLLCKRLLPRYHMFPWITFKHTRNQEKCLSHWKCFQLYPCKSIWCSKDHWITEHQKSSWFWWNANQITQLSAPILAGELSRLTNDSIDNQKQLWASEHTHRVVKCVWKGNGKSALDIFRQYLLTVALSLSKKIRLLTMVQHFNNFIDNDVCVGCMGMDFSKAFESLAHHLTICKLRAYGASQSACTLLAS